jgi:HAD superfamily hydrolase (TIGR01509 family)
MKYADNQFKLALFDLDGTLINTESQYTRFWEMVGEELDLNVPNLAQVIKGRTLDSIFQTFIPSEELQKEITYRLDLFEAQMQFPFYPGVLDFIDDVRKNGVKCAVVTSSNKAKMSAVKARIPNFEDLFDKVLTAEDFVASKPDPACYLYAAQVFSANKCECVVFEDAVNGLQAGVSAGMFTIGFATTNPRDVIEPLCHHVQDDFLHLSFTDVENMLVNYWTKG